MWIKLRHNDHICQWLQMMASAPLDLAEGPLRRIESVRRREWIVQLPIEAPPCVTSLPTRRFFPPTTRRFFRIHE